MLQIAKLALSTRPWHVAAVMVLGVVVAVVEGAGISLILPIVEGINTRELDEASHPVSRVVFDVVSAMGLPFTTTVLVLLGMGLFGLQAVLVLVRTMAIVRARVGLEVAVRTSLFARLLEARVGYFDSQHLGRLSNAVVQEAARAGAATLQLLNACVLGLLVTGYSVVAFVISWRLALLAAAMVAFVALVSRQGPGLRARGRRVTVANVGLETTAVEYLSAVREVNALGLQSHARALFDRAAGNVARENFRAERLVAGYRLAYEIAAVAMTAGLMGAGVLWLGVKASAVVAFFVLLFRLVPNAIQVQNSLHKFTAAHAGFEEVANVIADAEAHAASAVDAAKPVEISQGIRLSHVSFSYDGRTKALDDVSFPIERGALVGVVGASGAGKSTLVDLLLRFADPVSGIISVDGMDLRTVHLGGWRAAIGFVGQEAFLFHESIYRNIALGNLAATRDQVIEAAKQAGVHEFVGRLPNGYNTMIGDRGGMLSGGQRQRIALARALVRDPALLLLDEATSDLDAQSQAAIQRSLRSMHGLRTVVVVAHRLATVREADRIVVLDQGRVVEMGAHADLLAQHGHYSDLYSTEFGRQAAPR